MPFGVVREEGIGDRVAMAFGIIGLALGMAPCCIG